ncbi:tetraspanin-1-like [Tachyglossus aculeatus]|uniref:tetraspanin-1-like n=1 Tax=Tachyglossus aculeatus TaxID=9261 RepID=UPI0018F6FADC|nr:tetraspanin-1-like [Tachyglossus aculeatus]
MALMQDYGQLQPGAKMGGFSWIKILMVISSLTLYLAGGTLLGEGFWVSLDRTKVGSVLIAVGWVLILLSVLGCFAALKESRQLLLMFSGILILVFMAEIIAMVVALVYQTIPSPPRSHRSRSLIRKEYGSQESFTQAWNSTMEMLCCCGINGYADFEDSPFFNMAKVYPAYCCQNTTIRCTGAVASVDTIQGCFVWERWTSATVVKGVMAGIGALEIVAVGVALYFFGKLDTS